MIALALAACAAVVHPVAGDDVYTVSARLPRGEAPATLSVEVATGWHLNREYPMSFDAQGAGPFVFDDDLRGHVDVTTADGLSGTLHVSFCNEARCRIENVPVAVAP